MQEHFINILRSTVLYTKEKRKLLDDKEKNDLKKSELDQVKDTLLALYHNITNDLEKIKELDKKIYNDLIETGLMDLLTIGIAEGDNNILDVLNNDEIKILHFSDLHFLSKDTLFKKAKSLLGAKGHDKNKVRAFYRAIKSIEPNFCVITGDLVTWGDETSLNEAKNFIFGELEGKLCHLVNRDDIIIVPGNHDYIKQHYINGEKSYGRVFEGYADSKKKITVKKIDMQGISIIFYCFNTTSYKKTDIASGEVGDDLLNDFQDIINEEPDDYPNTKLRIVVCHHHLLNLNVDNSVFNLGRLKDSLDALEIFRKSHIFMVLHGHKHFNTFQTFNLEEGHKIRIISAGTAFQEGNHEVNKCGFNLIKIKPDKKISIQQYFYKHDGRQFEAYSEQPLGNI